MPPYFKQTPVLLLPVLLLFLSISVNSQQPKGLRPAETSAYNEGKTRALVIGISNYQYIEGLNFAHRDAEIFAAYLAKQQGLKAAPQDITLLTNENAKRGNILTELQRVALLSKPGDNLIFYFSGHGDVETITMFNKGYLLTYDTYSNNYMAGALSVNDLKDVFVTLTSNNVKVIVVTDACRSGKLAGGIRGVEFTASSLKPIWNNEIKILSSQPGQLSQEGKQWGDGRGVFSYYLVNGLEGAGDLNHDSLITLSELESYVGNIVSTSTGNDQQPIIDGPNKYSLIIADLKISQSKTGGYRTGNAIGSFAKFKLPVDSCMYYYEQMEQAIFKKDYKPGPSSAASFYRKLKACTEDNDLLLTANSKLLGGMMNTAQEIINNSFIGKNFVREEEYGYAGALLDEVIENNDLKLPNGKQIENLKRYLKVLYTTLWNFMEDSPDLDRTLDTALSTEPGAAYLLTAKGILELRRNNFQKAIPILEQASSNSPGWLIPKYYLGIAYGSIKDYRKALQFYQSVLEKDSLYRTFDCARCIQERMKEYSKRLNRVKYDKYLGNQDQHELDSVRNSLADNIDSAYYFYTTGNRYNKKNHPYRDSVYYLYSQAVKLDPWDVTYMYSFLDYLFRESYGHKDIQAILLTYLGIRKEEGYEEEDEENYLYENLMYSYLFSKNFDEAFAIMTRLHEAGYLSCKKVKKLSRDFKNYAPYEEFSRSCN